MEGAVSAPRLECPLRQPRIHYESGITRFDDDAGRIRFVRLVLILLLFLVALWVAIPAARVGLLLWTSPFRQAPPKPAGLAAQSVRFKASDGVTLRGWFIPSGAASPTVVLVPGFKDDRASMVPYARFLHQARFNVLLYDSRGTGGSDGRFSLGAREVRDVRGAVSYLQRRTDLRAKRFGVLGVSMGAGVAIVAAARLPAIGAVVADSAYTDQRQTVDRLDTLARGPISLPLAPIAPWLVDRVLGVRLASFSPLRAIPKIAPRAVLLIHSRHDHNPTTPLRGAVALQQRAGSNASLWIAPKGSHAGALQAQPRAYEGRVINFFRRHLGR
jgi:dipeptidyl aminopeptidase/acylaminoacyl peptidase